VVAREASLLSCFTELYTPENGLRRWYDPLLILIAITDYFKVVEYFIYNLLTNYASNTEIKGFVDKYDFYIFPVVNPDGKLRFSIPIMRLTIRRICLYPDNRQIVA